MEVKLWFFLGVVLAFTLGLPNVSATLTEVETSCGTWNCYTIFDTSFNIPNPYIGEIFDSEELPETYKKHHIGRIEGLQIEVLTKNSVKVTGFIEGATQNLWGIVLLGDESHANSTWWNSSYSKKQNITITETSGVDLKPYPVCFWFNHSGDAMANCQDVIVVNRTINDTHTYFGYDPVLSNSTHCRICGCFNLTASTSTTDLEGFYDNTTPVDWFNYTFETCNDLTDSFEDGEFLLMPPWDIFAEDDGFFFVDDSLAKDGNKSLVITNDGDNDGDHSVLERETHRNITDGDYSDAWAYVPADVNYMPYPMRLYSVSGGGGRYAQYRGDAQGGKYKCEWASANALIGSSISINAWNRFAINVDNGNVDFCVYDASDTLEACLNNQATTTDFNFIGLRLRDTSGSAYTYYFDNITWEVEATSPPVVNVGNVTELSSSTTSTTTTVAPSINPAEYVRDNWDYNFWIYGVLALLFIFLFIKRK